MWGIDKRACKNMMMSSYSRVVSIKNIYFHAVPVELFIASLVTLLSSLLTHVLPSLVWLAGLIIVS
jgi:hypothetical protein